VELAEPCLLALTVMALLLGPEAAPFRIHRNRVGPAGGGQEQGHGLGLAHGYDTPGRPLRATARGRLGQRRRCRQARADAGAKKLSLVHDGFSPVAGDGAWLQPRPRLEVILELRPEADRE